MNISGYKSTFLRAEDVKDKDTVMFMDHGDMMDSEYGPQLVFKVNHEGNEKFLSINKSNARALSEVFGDETKDWKGKEITLEIGSILVRGERKKTILMYPKIEVTEEKV